MELFLLRRYHSLGTNGEIYHEGRPVVKTIELPWRCNLKSVSCIPEGSYPLGIRITEARGKHLEVMNVRNRSHILFHAGNEVFKDLRGCIAPVSHHVRPGVGSFSRDALAELEALVFPVLEGKGEVMLHVCDEEEW
ncbi:MAG TPA: hypothetical protein DIW47_09240 [Bacteroidetes bacterium]|nr:hypothetical protein [Bacteroidota bacterium]